MSGTYLLLEDDRVISTHPSEDSALKAMRDERQRDLFSVIAKKRLLDLFIKGKYKLKEYAVVQVVSIKTINSDDDLNLIGGSF